MQTRFMMTICVILFAGIAVLIVGSQEGGERTQIVIDNYHDGEGTADWRDAQVAARVQPTNWVLITGGVLILLIWIVPTKRGIIRILGDK